MSGSPPGMLTIGAPHSSAAAQHCSGVRRLSKTWSGYWILPQPAHARLQRNRGSSISTSGYRLTPLSFWASTYVATVYIWETGTAMLGSSVAVRGGLYHPRGVSVNAGPSEEHLPVWYTPSDDRSGEDRSGPRVGQTDRGNGDGAYAGRANPALFHRHRGRVEAPGGIEPPHRSFADCSLSHLGTAPCREGL